MKKHFKVTASKNANKKSIKASTQKYELINYFDVWGNPEDGFDVNDTDRTGEIITITDDATDEDIVDGLINMGFLRSDAKGKIYVEDLGDGYIELSVEETGEPIGRLELVTASKRTNKKSIKASNSNKKGMKNMRNINASSNDPYTENLADFGMREIKELRDILDAWLNSGLPDDFYDEGVKPALNRNSGYVFLVNDDYQVCMEVDGKLESFYTTPYSGHEGFYEDLVDEADESWDEEDLEYLRDLAENRGDDDVVEQINVMLGTSEEEESEEE